MKKSLDKTARRAATREEAMARLEIQFPSVTQDQELIVKLSLECLSQKLRQGELSCLTVMEAFFAKAVEVNRRTNAVTEFMEEALELAKDMDQVPLEDRLPLHGVPFSVKVRLSNSGTCS